METTTEKPKTEKPDTSVTDRNGKVWELIFIVPMIKPLTAALGHPPREILTEPTKLIALISDPDKLARVAYILTPPVPPAIPKASEEEFAAALDSDALDQCAAAVIRLFSGMFAPRGRKAELADALIGELMAAGTKAAEQKAEQPVPVEPEQPAAV